MSSPISTPKPIDPKSIKRLSQRDMAGILGIDAKTLYNWKKHKPNLYRIVMLGFKFDALLECSRRNYAELLELEAQAYSQASKLDSSKSQVENP